MLWLVICLIPVFYLGALGACIWVLIEPIRREQR
jgi:hypothetical protein